MIERTITFACRVAVTVMAPILTASCGESTDGPHHGWMENDNPYAGVVTVGDESAMRATGSCDFSLATPPSVTPVDDADAACLCTRRSALSAELAACPPGVDWGVSATVGPAGGTILLRNTPSTRGSGVLLEIPPDALAEPTTIRIVETSLPPPAGFVDRSPLYVFEPVGLTFATPAVVRLPEEAADDVAFARTIYWSSESNPCLLEPLADDRDDAGFNQGSVRQLGWAIVGRPRAASAAACP